MKKKITLLTVVLAICMLATCVYATTGTAKATIALTSSKASLNPGDEVIIDLKTTGLEGLTGVDTYEAILSFDKDVFEPITDKSIVGGTGSRVETNANQNTEDYGHFAVTCDNTTKTVAEKITLKVKPQVKTTSTTVTISKFVAVEYDEQNQEFLKTSPTSTSITLQVKSDDSESGNNNVVNDNQVLGNNGGNISGTNTNKAPTNSDKTISGTKLPKTGVTEYVSVVIAIISIIAVVSIIRYKNIMK